MGPRKVREGFLQKGSNCERGPGGRFGEKNTAWKARLTAGNGTRR